MTGTKRIAVAVALVAGFRGHLPEETRLLRLGGELLEAGHRAAELGALLDEGLCAPRVVPERRARHLGVDGGEAGLLGGQVKDGLEDLRGAAPRPLRPASARSARRPPEIGEAGRRGGQRQTRVHEPIAPARVERLALPQGQPIRQHAAPQFACAGEFGVVCVEGFV